MDHQFQCHKRSFRFPPFYLDGFLNTIRTAGKDAPSPNGPVHALGNVEAVRLPAIHADKHNLFTRPVIGGHSGSSCS